MTLPVIAASLFFLAQTANGTIEGTVVNATTNKLIPGAQVSGLKVPTPPPPGAGTVTTQIPTGVFAVGRPRPDIPSVTTDSKGHFVFQNLEPGTYMLNAAADGYARQQYGRLRGGQTGISISINITGGQAVKDVLFHLVPAGNVSGRVTGQSGQPAVGIEILLLRSMYDAGGRKTFQQAATGRTDDRGEYRLFWVPPGRYYLSAGSSSRPLPGFNPFPMPGNNKYARTFYPGTTDPSAAVAIDIEPGGEVGGMDFRLNEQATYRVRGRVVDSTTGQIPRNVSISITPRDPIIMAGTSSTGSPYNGADGTFELRDVPSGSYWIHAQLPPTTRFQPGSPPPRPPMAVASIDVAGADVDGVVLTVLPPMSISGRIRMDGQSSASGLQGTSITLGPALPGFVPAPPPPPARPNAEGAFQMDGVVPGEYRVNVIGLQSVGQQSNVFLKEARFGSIDVLSQPLLISGPVSDQLEIVLGQNSGQISGTVLDERQQPLSTVQVVLVPDLRERRDLYKFAATDANGHFTLRPIPPGTYRLFASEDLEGNAIFDPDVMRRLEQNAKLVNVVESSNVTVELKVTPTIGR